MKTKLERKVDKKIRSQIKEIYATTNTLEKLEDYVEFKKTYTGSEGKLYLFYKNLVETEKISKDYANKLQTAYEPQNELSETTIHKWHKLGPITYKTTDKVKTDFGNFKPRLSLEEKLDYLNLLETASFELLYRADEKKVYLSKLEEKLYV